MLGAAVQLNVVWLVVTGFMIAGGGAVWKILPWAIKAGLQDVIEHQVGPMIKAVEVQVLSVNARIDDHMGKEEDSFTGIATDMSALREKLDERSLKFEKLQETLDGRTRLFDELQDTMEQAQDVLTKHMEHDEQQFESSSEALKVGQQNLIARLVNIEEKTENVAKALNAIETRKQSAKRRSQPT